MKKMLTVVPVLGLLAIAAAANAADTKTAAPAATATPAAAATMAPGNKMDAGKTDAGKMDATKGDSMSMAAPKPGEETTKLKALAGNWTWTGEMKEGAMGPGSKAMKTTGKANCKWIDGNLWLQCDASDTSGPMKWQGTYTIGWDFMQKGYRSVMVDNMGSAGMMFGTLEGTKLTLDLPPGVTMDMNGHKMAMRISWDWTDAKAVKFTMEQQMDGGAWTVSEENTMKKAGGGA
jgi:hypothetical protein